MKNLNHKSSLNREELDALLLSNVLPSKLDDFDREALEGFKKTGTTTKILSKLDRRYLYLNKLLLFLGSSFILIIAGLAVYLYNTNKIDLKPKVNKQNTIELTDYKLPNKINELQIITEKKRIQVQEIIKHFKDKQHDFMVNKEHKSESQTRINDLPKHNIERIPVIQAENEIITSTISAKEIYIEQLKLIDYRAYRVRPFIKTEQIVITGTPANLESNDLKDEETERLKVEIPYYDYIKKTVEIFAQANYKKSLARFEEVLDNYSDDLNAHFYGGLCYYNLGEIDKSISFFKKCCIHKFTNFNEEAEWYLAKCYLESDQIDKAESLLKKIIKINGFYTEQAEIILKNL